MKIAVCMKQICHVYARSGMVPENHYLTPDDKVYRVNPYDEAALELALRIKDLRGGSVVDLVTLGSLIAESESELRRCLATGADHLYQIDRDGGMDSWRKSFFLARAVRDIKADLVLCGKESLDTQNAQVGAFLAYRLGLPFISAITGMEILQDRKRVEVERKAGRGVRERVQCALPAVLSVDLGMALRLPRFSEKKRAESYPIQKLLYDEEGDPSLIVSAGLFPPRPRPKKVLAPDSRLEAFERIQLLLMGSRTTKKGVLLTGTTEDLVEGILSFLKEHRILRAKRKS
jgi:electron transfer flavoprotein beta subunit